MERRYVTTVRPGDSTGAYKRHGLIMSNKLTDKQLKFCEEYVVDLNTTQAAIRAGYSLKYAQKRAHAMLVNVGIQGEIARLQNELREVAIANGDIADPQELLQGYSRDLRFDPATVYNDKKRLIPIPDLPKEVRMSICGVKYNAQGKLEYKYPDRNKVRDSMGRMLGLTNGNASLIRELLENLGLVQINVQNNVTINNKTVQVMEKAIGRVGG